MSDEGARARAQAVTRRVGRAVFGDRRGLALFLAALCVVTATWRAGVFINDNYTLVWALDALGHGRVWLDRAGPQALGAPGTHVRDGLVYGRNYGQVALALPALWLLQAADAVVNLHLALVAGWHLTALALVAQLARFTGYDREMRLGGSAVVALSFLANAALVRTFFDASLPLLALQLTTALAAALLAVLLYRLVARRHGSTVGLYAGAGLVAASPVSLWATIPKRHVFSALFVLAVLWAFARSRDERGRVLPGVGRVPVYRAGAYALVGLFAWVHAAEALFTFFALVAVDLPTAPDNDRRTLAVVAAAFAVSLIPMLVTNALVTGEALRPPRAIGDQGITTPAPENGGAGSGGGTPDPGGHSATDGGSETGNGSTGSETAGGSQTVGSGSESGGNGTGESDGWNLVRTVKTFLGSVGVGVVVTQVLNLVVVGLWSFLDFGDLVATFVYSGATQAAQDTQFRGINLALLSAAPILGATLPAVVGAVSAGLTRLRQSLDATDALAVAVGVVFALVYNPRLPLNTQVTVRYLFVFYPLGVFLLARSAAVRRLLRTQRNPLLGAYAGGVAIGGQLLVAYFVIGKFAIGEAARVHALLGLVLGLAAALSVGATLVDRRADPVAAVTVGLAGATGTVFFLLSTLSHFAFVGEYVLPVARVISELVTTAG